MVAACAAARSPTEALTSLREAGAREAGVLAQAAARTRRAQAARARFTAAHPTPRERSLLFASSPKETSMSKLVLPLSAITLAILAGCAAESRVAPAPAPVVVQPAPPVAAVVTPPATTATAPTVVVPSAGTAPVVVATPAPQP